LIQKVVWNSLPQGTLADILKVPEFANKIDRTTFSVINSIKSMSNLGTHGEEVKPRHAKRTIEDIMEIVEWYFNRIIDLLRKLVLNKNDNIELSLFEAFICDYLSDLYYWSENYKKSLEYIIKSIDFLEKTIKGQPEINNDLKLLLTIRSNKLGKLYEFSGDYEKALIHFEKSKDIRKEFVLKEPDSIVYMNSLIRNYNYIARCNESLKNFERSLECYLKSSLFMENMIERDLGNIDIMMDLSISYINIFKLCSLKEKMTWLTKAHQMLKYLKNEKLKEEQATELLQFVSTEIINICKEDLK
jgi:tetratricopeptide (TPR) repeat protein